MERYDRTKYMKPEFELRVVEHVGFGKFPVNKLTGEVCECEFEWNADGSLLLCKHCGLDGT